MFISPLQTDVCSKMRLAKISISFFLHLVFLLDFVWKFVHNNLDDKSKHACTYSKKRSDTFASSTTI